MLLNFDRQRILIFGAVAFVLFIIIGFYHAPDYVDAGVTTRFKTSVSTWLKGTEPSLDDEMYRDSPHFSSPFITKPAEKPSEHSTSQPSVNHADTISKGDVSILPIEADDNVDVQAPRLPPPAAAASASDKKLPSANDLMNNLPPMEALTDIPLVSAATAASSHPTTFVTHTQPTTSASAAPETPQEAAFDADKWGGDEEVTS